MKLHLVWWDGRNSACSSEDIFKPYANEIASGEVRWWKEAGENRAHIKASDDVDFLKSLRIVSEIRDAIQGFGKDVSFPYIIFEEGDSLGSVGPLIDRLLAHKSHMRAVILYAIKALKGTRTLFASKQIGDIRRRLEVCLRC